ncbi:MAG: FHA domain-containing protein [Nocardioidaceae bacterium]
METSYVGGPGVLLARSRRWLLLDDDPPLDRLDEWWGLMGTAGPVRDRLIAALERVYPLHERSLVLVDLDDPEPAVTWGEGRVEVDGHRHVLSVGIEGFGSARPLLAGVVPAARVELALPDAAPVATGLIDGIPDDILASTASGPSSRPVFRPASYGDDDDEEATITIPRSAIAGQLPGAVEAPDQPGGDHDGATVYRSGLSDHLRQSTHETVLAVHCPQGHVTPAYTPTCRVCQTVVPPQEPRRIPRPRLGGLRLPNAELVPLDRGVVFGRKPAPVPGSVDWPHLVTLPQDSTYVSRMHLQIELDGWLVLARDLGSRGGTTLRIPGRLPQRIRANERYVLEPGHTLDLADSYEILYEVSAEVTL